MQSKSTTITRNTMKRLSIWALVVIGILLIPYMANFPWSVSDFVFAGGVLFGAATLYEITTMKIHNQNHRIAVGAAVLLVVFLIWGWAVA